MNEEPRYNAIYYESTTRHSQLIDIVGETAVSLSEVSAPIDWAAIFGNANPVEIEVGSGKGRFLLEASKRRPDINYVGVERAQKYVEITRERFEKYMRHFAVEKQRGMFDNVRLVWTDANYFLNRYVAAESVQAYHIYFPDPWPKKRQRKRRIFRNPEFLSGVTCTLTADGGRLYVVTDYAEYFLEIQERVRGFTPLRRVEQNLCDDEHIPTNFEMKYVAEGREIYRAVYEKGS